MYEIKLYGAFPLGAIGKMAGRGGLSRAGARRVVLPQSTQRAQRVLGRGRAVSLGGRARLLRGRARLLCLTQSSRSPQRMGLVSRLASHAKPAKFFRQDLQDLQDWISRIVRGRGAIRRPRKSSPTRLCVFVADAPPPGLDGGAGRHYNRWRAGKAAPRRAARSLICFSR